MKILKTSALFIGTSFIAAACAHAADEITVVNYGGSYAKACADAYHERFEKATGIKVNLEDYNGGLAEVRTQVDADSVHWDVIHADSPDHLTGCDEGVLEPLSDINLPPSPNGIPAEEDFFDGALTAVP